MRFFYAQSMQRRSRNKTKSRLIFYAIFSVVFAILGFAVAKPILEFFVSTLDVRVISTDITQAFYMQLTFCLAFGLFPWLVMLHNIFFKNTPFYIDLAGFLSGFIVCILYPYITTIVRIQFFDNFQIEGVHHYVNLSDLNVGKQLLVGLLIGFVVSTITTYILNRKRRRR